MNWPPTALSRKQQAEEEEHPSDGVCASGMRCARARQTSSERREWQCSCELAKRSNAAMIAVRYCCIPVASSRQVRLIASIAAAAEWRRGVACCRLERLRGRRRGEEEGC